ncbi:MAG TPA: glycosyltransferase family 4 protein [Verrucomicrobiae bacterium]|nr:glycosyltransferase family 4 protein [Verrucomicrobiae bacterium]
MRLALVLAGRYPDVRGSQVLVQQLADGLRGRGHGVHLVTYGAAASGRPGPRFGRVARDAALVARLWRTVRREAIDLIHAHNYEAAIASLLVGRATGRPVVYHGHNALAEELPLYFRARLARELARQLGRLLDAHVPRRADFCIAVTEELGEILRRRGVAARDLTCIAPAAAPRDAAVHRPRSGQEALVCYAGNLDGYQNLGFLLRSFARVRAWLPAARLVLVTHAAPGVLRRAVGPGVEIVRATSYDEVRARLDAADVAVSPRVERSGFPMKLLNYMAAGKAIVASAGSAKGLRDGVTGRIVPDGDEAAFAAAVIELLSDPTARAALGTAARRAVEDARAWDGVLDRVETVYRNVLAARSAARAELGAGRSALGVAE